MGDATELGKIFRKYMAENNLSQQQLAKELEVSPAMFSNYITGKNVPDIKFLVNCIKKFNLEKKTLADFIYTAFLSSAEKNLKIVIDTQFIESTQFGLLAKVLTILMLYPPVKNDAMDCRFILDEDIHKCFKELDWRAVFSPPAD